MGKRMENVAHSSFNTWHGDCSSEEAVSPALSSSLIPGGGSA